MHKKRISYVQVTCNENIFKPTWLSVKIFRNQNIYSHDFKTSQSYFFCSNDLSASDAGFHIGVLQSKGRSVVLE